MLSVKDVQETIVVAFDFSAVCELDRVRRRRQRERRQRLAGPGRPARSCPGRRRSAGTKVLQAITGGRGGREL
jgi:hypothetical protein